MQANVHELATTKEQTARSGPVAREDVFAGIPLADIIREASVRSE
jgi:hypothetical protein